MKVVYVLNSTFSLGGASKAFLAILKGMMEKEKDFIPIVVVPDANGLCGVLQSMGVRVIVLPMRMNIYPMLSNFKDYLLFFPRFMFYRFVNRMTVRKLVNLLHEEHIDLIHTNVGVMDVGYRVAQKLNIPHIYHLREYADKQFDFHVFPSKKNFHRKIAAENSYSICITKDIQKYHEQTAVSRSRVIYDGAFSRQGLLPRKEKEPYLLYAGRIESGKGLLDMLRAYCQYVVKSKGNALPLHVAGNIADEVYGKKVTNFLQENALTDYVKFLGLRNDIAQIMQQATAIIIPSRSEGFGLCMAEAMFYDCLVIAHDVDGLKEQFNNGLQRMGREIGLRYLTDDELCQHLMDVSKKGIAFYEQMIQDAKATVMALYTAEANVESVYRFYHEILKADDSIH